MRAADLAEWAAALPPDAEVLLEHPETHELYKMLPMDAPVAFYEDDEQGTYILSPAYLEA